MGDFWLLAWLTRTKKRILVRPVKIVPTNKLEVKTIYYYQLAHPK